ncbi:MAG: undecaprenyl-phosphate glucose phosphotransferase [Clostridia bacterium]|nr:undecaprenyl-phosphate glucose phosphotransferase [Clostridia bacterium]
MVRQNQAFLNKVNILLDMLIVTLSYIFASWFRLEKLHGMSDNMAALSGRTVLLAFAYSLMLFFVLSLLGFYNTTRTRRLVWKMRTIFLGVSISTLIATALFYLFRLEEFSRGVLLIFYAAANGLLIGKYAFMRLVLSRFRFRGYNLKHVLVIGTGRLALQYRADVLAEPELGFRILGFAGTPRPLPEGAAYLGAFSQLDSLLNSPDVQEVVIALEPEEYVRIQEIIAVCERNGVQYSVIPFYNDVIPANPTIEMIGRSKLINMRVNRLENVGWALAKRSFDLLASGLGLILLSPLMLCIAIGVKRSSPGPVLFRQTRVGYQRKEFQMLKFRSMRVNPEENTAWSQEGDPRRTRFGAFLRRTSLDELPQLWNTFRGDMSLVGPRPELPYFVEQFRQTVPYYMVKHQVKPGMTGWAQIHGYRGDTSIERRIELDLWYIEHWSPWLDIRILLRTLFGGMRNREE